MYKRIMITLDGSELAEQALDHAVKLATCFQADLYAVRVVIPFGMLVPTTMEYDLSENYRRNVIQEAHVYLNKIEAKLKPILGNHFQTQVIEGIVVNSILEFADSKGIDLIVMATHGRSGLGRWVFGSVAERIVHAANVPVFLVRAKAITKKEKKATQEKAAV